MRTCVPIDEVVGTGGALAHYAARGAHVVLVCATLGEAGEIVDAAIGEDRGESEEPGKPGDPE